MYYNRQAIVPKQYAFYGSRYAVHINLHAFLTGFIGQAVVDAMVASYPGDLTTLPGGEATPPEVVTKSKRKQTLLSLLDALQELSKDEELDVTGVFSISSRRTICS